MRKSGKTAPKRILCAGRIYCDLVLSGLSGAPMPGQEVYAEGLTLTAGGGAYNTGAYLAALGRGVGLAGVIPAEPFAAAISAELVSAGLDLGPCDFAPPGVDPQVTVALTGAEDRAYVTRRTGPAVPAGLGALLDSGAWDHLHIGELATLLEAPDCLARAKAAGMSVSLDCAWDAEVLARDDLPLMLRGVDLFLPNRDEAKALQRHAPLEDHAPLVVVKDGPSGAVAHWAGGEIARPALAVEVVDSVGAGDAFNAGFLDLWLDGAELGDCLESGAKAAAVALTRRGCARGLSRLARHRPA